MNTNPLHQSVHAALDGDAACRIAFWRSLSWQDLEALMLADSGAAGRFELTSLLQACSAEARIRRTSGSTPDIASEA